MAVSAGGTSPVCLGQPGCAGAGPVQAVTVTAITDLLRVNGVVTQSPSRRTDDTTVPVRSPVNAAVKGATTASANRPVIICSPVVVGIFSTNVPVKLPRVQLLTPCRVLPKRPGLVTGCPLTVAVQVAVPVSPWVVTAWWRACVVRPGWMSVVSVMVQDRLALRAVRPPRLSRKAHTRYAGPVCGSRFLLRGWRPAQDTCLRTAGGAVPLVTSVDPIARPG